MTYSFVRTTRIFSGLAIACAAGCSPPDAASLSPAAPRLHSPRAALGALPLRYGPLEPLLPRALRTAAAPAARVQVPARTDLPARFRDFASTLESDRLQQGTPGLAVAIVERGEVSFAQGFGTKDAASRAPILPSTLFRIASNSKPLTAVAVMQSVQAGELSLDAALTDYVPGFQLAATPESVPGLTLRRLLSHTSGLADYLEVDVPAEEKRDAALEGFLLGRYRDLGYTMAAPGDVFSYSNAGFSLLGLVAQTARATPFRKLLRERVLAPLHMDRTYLLPAEVLADGDYALGHCPADLPECGGFGIGPVIAPDSYDNAWSRPAAGVWSSVLDLAKFARFLVHGSTRVLPDEARALMTTPVVSTRFVGDELGYGLGVETATGIALESASGEATFHTAKVISHTGLLPGFLSDVECAPELDFCLIALANDTSFDFSTLRQAAFRLAALPAASERPDVSPRPERFAEYVGTYFSEFSTGEYRVSDDGAGGLRIDFLLADAFRVPYSHELIPTLVDNFVFQVGGSVNGVTFLQSSTGGYDYLRISDRDVAARVVEPEPADEQ